MTEQELKQQIIAAIQKARETTPLTPSITNTVTTNLVANAQLAVGGSAAMIYLPDEAEAMARIGGSFYINMGTLLPVYAETLPRVIRVLKHSSTPWVLDPVGIGVGALRESLLLSIKDCPPSIIRGNASEIIALANLWGLDSGKSHDGVRGVDSTDSVVSSKKAAVELARFTKGAVSVSGEIDLITDGETTVYLEGGSELCTKITGAGCSLGGVTAVFAAVATPFIAALTASSVYKVASGAAEKNCKGPASFQMAFVDNLYSVSAEQINGSSLKIEKA
ncbi:hydroxyethylthiazole kinase [Succinivibrio dextrinosolvens]|uniref:hydroxyethylthiazole kinase n=1 Tax=Succinivibrio dextrinosolvens TaxID=83771 RepID=UPI0008EBC537|nr:hydroxyethylthiazole kinase [Succinivibrio dextrinosolvens]SFS37912.1 hydroxyethylthiazole kinase [Succinivibrio dextrinosolvens]